jgi:RNA polymerase sigma factor (sigma-70 family)
VRRLYKNIIREVFEDNYARFRAYLKGRFFSLNDYDAEDLIQQTALRLLYRGEDIAGIKNLTSYVYAALENAAKDLFRKRKNETLNSEYPEGSVEDAAGYAIAGELKSFILAALEKMDEKQRYVFIETEIKGRSYLELAEETGEKLGTLLSRKSRAAKKLKEAIEGYMNQEDTKHG